MEKEESRGVEKYLFYIEIIYIQVFFIKLCFNLLLISVL
jgi:hypothetical protein